MVRLQTRGEQRVSTMAPRAGRQASSSMENTQRCDERLAQHARSQAGRERPGNRCRRQGHLDHHQGRHLPTTPKSRPAAISHDSRTEGRHQVSAHGNLWNARNSHAGGLIQTGRRRQPPATQQRARVGGVSRTLELRHRHGLLGGRRRRRHLARGGRWRAASVGLISREPGAHDAAACQWPEFLFLAPRFLFLFAVKWLFKVVKGVSHSHPLGPTRHTPTR